MSTEHQQYSTDNQLDAIVRYAHAHGMQVARTYSDSGRSGLNLAGREGLRDLLHDVENGRADYSVILVYDVVVGDAFKMQTRVPTMNTSVNERVSPFIIALSNLRMMAACLRPY